MTAIRHSLQREIFQPDDERLLSVINVLKPGKKKKNCFLCITVTTHAPVSVRLYQVKVEKNDVFKKKRYWLLRDIRQVDGIDPRHKHAVPEFELLIDRAYRWIATNVAEKDPFIKQLWKLSSRYLPVQKPEFVNVPLPTEEFEFDAEAGAALTGDGGAALDEPADDYQPISAKEEADFRRLLARCQLTVGRADEFADELARELSVLDGANIQAMMGSERAVGELMAVVQAALDEADAIEQRLDTCDQLLAHVRDSVETMEEKDSLTNVEAENREKLAAELRQFVAALDLSDEDEQVLLDGRLNDPANINRCTRAAQQLQRCMQAKVTPGLDRMASYNEQIRKFARLSERFSEKLVAHLTTVFQNLSDNDGGAQWHALCLPKHSQRHHALMPFSELILWLKQARADGYNALIERYVSYTKELYKRDLDAFFDSVRSRLRSNSLERRGSIMMVKSPSANLDMLKPADKFGGSDTSLSERETFERLVETLLSEVEPVVLSEQKFCVRLFHITSEALLSAAADTQSVASSDSGSDRRTEKQFNEQVRTILSQLFQPLTTHLHEFVEHAARQNAHFVMVLLVRLSKKTLGMEDAAAYIATILGTVVVMVKRRFDVLMESETRQLAEVRLTKKSRVGLLETLRQFERLATEAEAAFAGSERRADLDRWYPQLVGAVCEGVEAVAADPNSKSPPSVVRMENYHHLFSVLSQLKIACLEALRKSIRQKYQDNLEIYVKENMGKPLERLQDFFDKVERCIQQGMRPEEIGYQQAFNKQELRKVIAYYPGKEVRKGLDQLYRKAEKHLVDGSTLLQVVWRNMQDEFLQQLKHYDQLMGRCYPSSKIDLEFSIPDVLQYFSDIAQQH